MLNQMQEHPEQRALDVDWVEKLVGILQGNLNRPLYPVGAVLEGDENLERLQTSLQQSDPNGVPALPAGIKLLVFAGQHRLAALPRLGLDQDELWWHADVFTKRKCSSRGLSSLLNEITELELDHPAEFLTMMHESNSPDVKMHSQDADLFLAAVKLKRLLTDGRISKQIFFENRRMLLSHNETTARSIYMLSRDDELAEAVALALSRPHIKKIFKAGQWKGLTTGRFFGVCDMLRGCYGSYNSVPVGCWACEGDGGAG